MIKESEVLDFIFAERKSAYLSVLCVSSTPFFLFYCHDCSGV